LFAVVACGGEFSTRAVGGSDAGVGGSTAAGGATSTGGRTGTGGSSGGKGGINSGTGGISRGGSVGAGGAIGAGGITGAGGTVSSEEDAFRTQVMQLYCASFVTCCSSGGIVFDQAQCETSFGTLVLGNLGSPRSGYYTFDAAAGARCLDTIRATLGPGCNTFPSSIACYGVFQGILKPGDPCETAVECARGPDDSISCDPGTDGIDICILKRRASEGEPCVESCVESGSLIDCDPPSTAADRGRCFENDGLYCSGGVCARQVAIGSLCDDNAACVDGAKCDVSVGICVPLADVGKPCGGTDDCREELHCSTEGLCEPDHAPGEACGASSECGPGTCRGGTCSSMSLGMTILCGSLAGVVPTP